MLVKIKKLIELRLRWIRDEINFYRENFSSQYATEKIHDYQQREKELEWILEEIGDLIENESNKQN